MVKSFVFVFRSVCGQYKSEKKGISPPHETSGLPLIPAPQPVKNGAARNTNALAAAKPQTDVLQ